MVLLGMEDNFDIEQIDADPILSALYGALNLQVAVAYYIDAYPWGMTPDADGLDGKYHFDKIREAIKVRTAELNEEK